MITSGDCEKVFPRAVWPFSCSRRIRLHIGRGKCFRISQVWVGCRRRWKRCQNLKRNTPALHPPPPLWHLAWCVSSLSGLSLSLSLYPRYTSLCYVNCFKLEASSLRLFSILVVFLPTLRTRHILAGLSSTKLRFHPGLSSLEEYEEYVYCWATSSLLSDITSDSHLITFHFPSYHSLYSVEM